MKHRGMDRYNRNHTHALFDFSLDEAALATLGALDEGAPTGWDSRPAP